MLIEVMSFPTDRDNQHPILRERLVKCIHNARESESSMKLLEAILHKALKLCKEVKIETKERAKIAEEKQARLAEEVEELMLETEDDAAELEEEFAEEDAELGATQDAEMEAELAGSIHVEPPVELAEDADWPVEFANETDTVS